MTCITSVIENLTVREGESRELTNGVYLIKGTVKVEKGGELSIENSKLLMAEGAGIVVLGGTLKVKNTIFTAEDRRKGWKNLVLIKPRGYIVDTVFEFGRGREGEEINKLSELTLDEGVIHGGAIYIELGDEEDFEITDSKFYKCGAEYGGAIFAHGHIKLVNCFFENCFAHGEFGSGGAVYASRASEIKGCLFRNCRAVWGGAVYLFDGNFIGNSSFVNCRGEKDGGAAFVWNENVIFRCSFNNCTAKNWGGAVKSYAFNTVEKCHFEGCATPAEGGALDLTEHSFVKDSIFRRCVSAEGGAISAYLDNEISGCIFEACEAERGGGVKIGEKNRVLNCLFDRCGAQEKGGAIYQKGKENELKNNLLIDCHPD